METPSLVGNMIPVALRYSVSIHLLANSRAAFRGHGNPLSDRQHDPYPEVDPFLDGNLIRKSFPL